MSPSGIPSPLLTGTRRPTARTPWSGSRGDWDHVLAALQGVVTYTPPGETFMNRIKNFDQRKSSLIVISKVLDRLIFRCSKGKNSSHASLVSEMVDPLIFVAQIVS